MATIKSFTSLEQSRKLAEILPLESADMYYPWYIEEDRDNIKSGHRISIPSVGNFIHKVNILPCWSLAALLSALPIVYTNNKKEVCGPLHIDITDSETPFALWYVNPLHKGSIVELQTKEYDNLVDACVEMIIKVHELKML